MIPIIIPSKNIYDKDNNFSRDNIVNKVEISYYVGKEHEEIKSSIKNITTSDGISTVQTPDFPKEILSTDYTTFIEGNKTKIAGVLSSIIVEKEYEITLPNITIPRRENSYFITSAYNPRTTAEISIEGQLITETGHTADIIITKSSKNITIYPVENPRKTTEEISYSLENISLNNLSFYNGESYQSEAKYIVRKPTVSYWKNEEENVVINDFSAIVGLEYYEINEDLQQLGLIEGAVSTTGNVTKYIYNPQKVTIDFKGNILTLQIEENQTSAASIGNEDIPMSLSVNGNEFLQEKLRAIQLASNIVNQYSKGKKTTIIKCGINDYYSLGIEDKLYDLRDDYPNTISSLPEFEYISDAYTYVFTPPQNKNISHIAKVVSVYDDYEFNLHFYLLDNKIYFRDEGAYSDDIRQLRLTYYYYPSTSNKRIDISNPERMCFSMHDIVIPMKMNEFGEDIPLINNEDGSLPLFEVVGIGMVYDGAVYQELSLQEYKGE